MKTSIKKIPWSIVELTIEESKENVLRFRKKVLNYLQKNAEIKGFRKWSKIPEHIIIRNYWEEKIFEMVVDEALNSTYQKALKQNNILPVSQWEISEIVSQDPLIIKIKVEVFPEVEIKNDYKKIKLKKTISKITQEEVNNEIENIRKKFAKFEQKDDSYLSKMWDKLVIDTIWFDKKWNPLENTNMEKYPLILWSNIFVAWFEEQLIWKKKWEKIKINIKFPSDYYNTDFAWKEVKFDVFIHEVWEEILPEFTPEFIKNLRWTEMNFENFKKQIEKELQEQKDQNNRLKDENALIDELEKMSTIEFWKNLLNHEIEKVYAEIKENITNSWAKVADYLASINMTEEQYKNTQVKPIAERRLKAELILHKLQELEKVEVSEDEIQKEIKEIISRFQNEEVISRLNKLYSPGSKRYEELKSRITYRKLIDSFFE